MAKIKTININIAGVEESLAIWFTESSGFHLKSFPKQILEITGHSIYDFKNHKTFASLTDKIHSISKIYESRIRTRKKVIYIKSVIGDVTFCRIGTTDLQINGSGRSYSVKNAYKNFNSDFGDHTLDYGFCFSYDIGYEYAEGDKKYYTVLNIAWSSTNVNPEKFPNEYSFHTEGYHVIEWTQQREDYFKKLSETMDMMAEKFAEFFKDTQKAIIAIDKNKSIFLIDMEK